MSFDSAPSTTDSGSVEGGSAKGGVRIGLDIDNEKKAPSDVPKQEIPGPNKLARYTMFDFPVTNYPQFVTGPEEVPLPNLPSPPSQMGFSFQPGDDSNLFSRLSQQNSSDTTRNILATYLRHRGSSASASHSETSSFNAHGRSNRAKSSPLEAQVKFTTSSHHLDIETGLQGDVRFRRETSDSSIITAVRDNSGRSSANVDGNKSQVGRQRLDGSSGSNEATAAAQRALAGATATKIKGRNKNPVKDRKSFASLADESRGIKTREGSSESPNGGRKDGKNDNRVSEKESNSANILKRKVGKKAEKAAGKF